MTYLDDQDVNRQTSLASLQEEFQIRVENLDKGTSTMWSEDLFQERLEGMRDALALFEEKKQKAIAKAQAKEERRLARLKEREEKERKQSEQELKVIVTELSEPVETEEVDKYDEVFGDVE